MPQPKSRLLAIDVAELEDVIIVRRKYYRDQEAQINDLLESGNTRLMELNHDIMLAESELKRLKHEIVRAKQDKRMLFEDLDLLRLEITQLDTSLGISQGFVGVVRLQQT